MTDHVTKSDAEWRAELDPETYRAILSAAGLDIVCDGAKTGVWLARRAFLSAK